MLFSEMALPFSYISIMLDKNYSFRYNIFENIFKLKQGMLHDDK